MAELCERHEWSITDIRNGYLVTEGCAHCGGRLSFFSTKSKAPVDYYQEGEHFWRYLGSAQAVKFNLICDHCGDHMDLRDVVAMMFCTLCDPECRACKAADVDGPVQTWVYVAMCNDTTHASGRCVAMPKVDALSDYFNQRIRSPDKRVRFVPCDHIGNIDACQGEVLTDTGLTDIY